MPERILVGVTVGRRIAAVGLGALLALAAGEGVARIARGPALDVIVRDAATGMAMPVDDGRVYAGRPGFDDDAVQLDGRGLRVWHHPPDGEPEDPAEIPDAGCATVVLGDSVAFGHGVSAEESFVARLSAELPGGAVPLAFPGWNTAQEASAVEVLGGDLDVDVLVVAWVSNDVASLEWNREEDGADAMYVRRELRPLPAPSIDAQVRLWRRSALFRVVSDALGGDPVLLDRREHDEALARIARWADERGVPVILAQVPPFVDRPGWDAPWGPGRPVQPHQREPAWRAAKEVAESAGMRVVDLTEAVAVVRPSTLGLDPIHPNAAGHARIAGILLREVRELCGG